MANLSASYSLRRPLIGNVFNTRDYPPASLQILLADVEAMLEYALYDRLQVARSSAEMGTCGAVLVIPDFWDRVWVREWVQLLLKAIGFGRVTVLQVYHQFLKILTLL